MLKKSSLISDLILGWYSVLHFSGLITCSVFPQDVELKELHWYSFKM